MTYVRSLFRSPSYARTLLVVLNSNQLSKWSSKHSKRFTVAMDFKEGTTYVHMRAAPGMATLNEFSKLECSSKKNDLLISYGLSPQEVKLFNDYGKGSLETAHKTHEKSILANLIEEIKVKIQRAQTNHQNDHSSENSTTNEESQKTTERFVHPINNLEELKTDLFGHLDGDNSDSYTKRRKLIRRMHRKFNQDLSLPEPKRKINISKDTSKTAFNDFVMVKQRTEDISVSTKPNSKWDIKHVDKPESSLQSTMPDKKDKVYGCSGNKLYTIKDGKIMQLKEKQKFEPKISTVDVVSDGKKLSLDEILSKFKNYNPGLPYKILFIKNISNGVAAEDFDKLLKNNPEFENIRIMTGKMKGQAFATFKNVEGAEKALEQLNGLYLKGKPIIIQFGKNTS